MRGVRNIRDGIRIVYVYCGIMNSKVRIAFKDIYIFVRERKLYQPLDSPKSTNSYYPLIRISATEVLSTSKRHHDLRRNFPPTFFAYISLNTQLYEIKAVSLTHSLLFSYYNLKIFTVEFHDDKFRIIPSQLNPDNSPNQRNEIALLILSYTLNYSNYIYI